MNAPTADAAGLIIWGAKGHALVLAEFAATAGLRLVALVDNDPALVSPIDDVPLLVGPGGLDAWLADHASTAQAFAIAIGGSAGRDRLELHAELGSRGLRAATLVHPAGYVARDARLSAGAQVLANAVVGARATVGRQCIINTSASVDHECELADGVHIGPGATLAGCVVAGEAAFIGAGAVVLPNVHIGADAIVGAGAVVTDDVPDGAVVKGNPAR